MTVADLRTARLTLRGLRESDTEAVVEVFAAPEMNAAVVEHDGAVIGPAHIRPSAA